MARMPLKRQKRSFVDRLLELNIISDKKQCRKKRQKGSMKSGGADGIDRSSGLYYDFFFSVQQNYKLFLHISFEAQSQHFFIVLTH